MGERKRGRKREWRGKGEGGERREEVKERGSKVTGRGTHKVRQEPLRNGYINPCLLSLPMLPNQVVKRISCIYFTETEKKKRRG
jgi:hypothetical protein